MTALNEVIDSFLADRRARGVAAGTLRAEKSTLRLLLADVGNIDTRRIRPQHLDTFWANRTTWSAGTMNRGRYHLNNFFAWCRIRGHLPRDYDPMHGTRKIRVPPRDRFIIPQSQFETFLDGIKNPRQRIVVALGLYLFVRKSETEALRWQDINLDSMTAEVYRPKTQTLDTLPICEELAKEIQRWKLAYAAKVGEPVKPAWFLVPSVPQGGGLRGQKGQKGFSEVVEREYQPTVKANVSWMIKNALQDAGYYQMQEGGHTLRRSGATALYNQLTSVGHDRAIRICQAMLGHSSVQTTEVYLRLDLDRKVRNDLLAGKRMFPEGGTATVIRLGGSAVGEEDARAV